MRPSPTNHDRCKIDWLTQALDPAAMTAAAPPTGIAARQPGKSCPSRKNSAAPTMAAKPATDAKSATGGRIEYLPHATARSQFPHAAKGQEKSRHRMSAYRGDLDAERHGREQSDRRGRGHAQIFAYNEKERPEDIELLLDPERPQVQQRFGRGVDIEISGLRPQHDIGGKRRAADDVKSQPLEF